MIWSFFAARRSSASETYAAVRPVRSFSSVCGYLVSRAPLMTPSSTMPCIVFFRWHRNISCSGLNNSTAGVDTFAQVTKSDKTFQIMECIWDGHLKAGSLCRPTIRLGAGQSKCRHGKRCEQQKRKQNTQNFIHCREYPCCEVEPPMIKSVLQLPFEALMTFREEKNRLYG